jgi:hypothetical protein
MNHATRNSLIWAVPDSHDLENATLVADSLEAQQGGGLPGARRTRRDLEREGGTANDG